MKMHILRRQQQIPLPLESVFAFFQRPENLARITPPQLGFTILTPSPIEMKEGALIDYTIRVAGLRVHWTTHIAAYHPPFVFVDQQIRGPYAFWHHTHRFSECEGGTLMEDEVRYALPFGPVGTLAHDMFVRRQVEEIFAYRSNRIPVVLGLSNPPSGQEART